MDVGTGPARMYAAFTQQENLFYNSPVSCDDESTSIKGKFSYLLNCIVLMNITA